MVRFHVYDDHLTTGSWKFGFKSMRFGVSYGDVGTSALAKFEVPARVILHHI